MNDTAIHPIRVTATESIGMLVYFGAYMGYLFIHPESEAMHWLTLVVVPLVLLAAIRKPGTRNIRSLLASIGLRRGNLTRGLGWACVVGLILSALQLVLSRSAGEIMDIILSGRALYLFPVSFVLMFLTAGFTEEFLFRGVLQTRLEFITRSKLLAVGGTALLFGFYHVPYAYLNPHWPSAGDWGAAWTAALSQGIPGGLILGAMYVYTDRNLLACIVVHSLINALPAMSLIHFGGS